MDLRICSLCRYKMNVNFFHFRFVNWIFGFLLMINLMKTQMLFFIDLRKVKTTIFQLNLMRLKFFVFLFKDSLVIALISIQMIFLTNFCQNDGDSCIFVQIYNCHFAHALADESFVHKIYCRHCCSCISSILAILHFYLDIYLQDCCINSPSLSNRYSLSANVYDRTYGVEVVSYLHSTDRIFCGMGGIPICANQVPSV